MRTAEHRIQNAEDGRAANGEVVLLCTRRLPSPSSRNARWYPGEQAQQWPLAQEVQYANEYAKLWFQHLLVKPEAEESQGLVSHPIGAPIRQ